MSSSEPNTTRPPVVSDEQLVLIVYLLVSGDLIGRQAWQVVARRLVGRRAISMGCVLDQNSAGK
jgi:hypothetical protein